MMNLKKIANTLPQNRLSTHYLSDFVQCLHEVLWNGVFLQKGKKKSILIHIVITSSVITTRWFMNRMGCDFRVEKSFLDKSYQEICLFGRGFSRLYYCQNTQEFKLLSRNGSILAMISTPTKRRFVDEAGSYKISKAFAEMLQISV